MPFDYKVDPRAIASWNLRASQLSSHFSEFSWPKRDNRTSGSHWADKLTDIPTLVAGVDGQRIGPITSYDDFGFLRMLVVGDGDRLECLTDEGCELYTKLVEILLRASKPLAQAANTMYLSQKLGIWLEKCWLSQGCGEWSEWLSNRLVLDIDSRTVWVPLDGIRMNLDRVNIRDIALRRVPNSFVDSMIGCQDLPPEHQALFERHCRDTYQARTVVELRVEGVPEARKERAFQRVDQFLPLLRFFHPASLEVRHNCLLARLGQVSVSKYHLVELEQDSFTNAFDGIDSSNTTIDWTIDQDYIDKIVASGFKPLARAFMSTQRTVWQGQIVGALTTYTNGTLYSGASERLLHAFAAAESLFMKSKEGSIQQTLALRLAYIVGSDVEERLKIKDKILDAYDLRSKFVHEGRLLLPSDARTANAALRIVWAALLAVARRTDIEDASQVISDIERRVFE